MKQQKQQVHTITRPLYSFPAPNVASGSFVADLDLGLPEPHSWKPTKEELMVISAQIHRLAEQELPFQRLTIDTDTALAMFEENPYKTGQIPNIADKRGKLTVYKVGPRSTATTKIILMTSGWGPCRHIQGTYDWGYKFCGAEVYNTCCPSNSTQRPTSIQVIKYFNLDLNDASV